MGLGLFKCITFESMNIVSFDSGCQNTDILDHNKHVATSGEGVFRSTPADFTVMLLIHPSLHMMNNNTVS